MMLVWGLAAPLLVDLSLTLLVFLVCGAWILFSRYQKQGQVAAKTKISKQHEQIKKHELTVSQLKKAGMMMNINEADLTCIPRLSMNWSQEYARLIDRCFDRIIQRLDNIRSALIEKSLQESRDLSSSVSDIVGTTGNRSSDSSVSSVSRSDSSNPSYPVFPGGATRQFRSHSLRAFSRKEPPVKKSREIIMRDVQGVPEQGLPKTQLESANDHQGLSYNPAPSNIAREGLITPVKLLQIMNSMGLVNELYPHVIKPAEIAPKPQYQIMDYKKATPVAQQTMDFMKKTPPGQPHITEPDNPAPRNIAREGLITPVKLLQIMNSMGLVNELYPHVIKPAEIAPKPQYQIMDYKKATPVAQQTMDFIQKTPPGQPHITEPDNPAPRNIAREGLITPVKLLQIMNSMGLVNELYPHVIKQAEIAPKPQYQIMDYKKATPVAQQTMDFMKKTPPGQPHITEPRALIQTKNLTPLPAQPDVLTSTVPRGAAESRGIPPQLPTTVLASSGVILLPSGQSLHALKVTSIVQAPPGVGSIPPLQVVEPPGLTPQPVAQVKEPLDLPSGFQVQAGDSVGMTPQHQGAESLQEMKHLRGKAIPQPKDSMNLTRNETLETRNQAVKEMEQTPEAQIPIKDALDLLPESEVENMNSAVMAPEPQPSDGKFLRGTLESCSEISLSPEYEDRQTVTLTFPKIDTQGGMIQHQGAESLQEMKHLGGKAIPQPKDSMNLTRNETLETRNQAVKEMEQTPEAQIPIKDALDLLPESEVENMNSAVMAPEPQPSDGKFLRGTLESCSEISLSPEYEDRQTVTLTFPKIDTQGGMIQHQGAESLQEMKHLGGKAIPQPKDSMNLTRNETLETRNQAVKEMEQTPEAQIPIKDALDLLPESEVENMNSAVMAPEPQPSDGKFLRGTLESCSEISLSPEYEDRQTVTLTFPKIDTQGGMIQHQGAESLQEMKHLGGKAIPQPKDSMNLTRNETLETRNQAVKEMEQTPEAQIPIKDALDLLPESEVENMNSAVMAPEPQPSDGKFLRGTLESCSEISLSPEYEDRQTVTLTFPKIDTQGGMIQHQGAESLQEMKHLGGKAIPQPKDSMNLTRNETLETRNQAVKEMEQTPEAQIPIKDALDLLPESEVENMNSAVMAPEPQPSDGKFLRGTLESCSEISLSPEYEDRQTVTLTFPKIDTQGGMIQHQGAESLQEMKHLGGKAIPQPKDSMNLTRNETLETRNQAVKEMEQTPEAQIPIKDALDLLPESEVENMNSAVMAPEPQPSDGKFLRGTLESCSEISLSPEYEDRQTVTLTFPKIDTQGGMIQHQGAESLQEMKHLGGKAIPQPKDSMNLTRNETLETRNQAVKEMEQTPEAQIPIKDALDLLPESEVENMNSAVMAPEPQPSDGKFLRGTLESCSEISLSPEYEDRQTVTLTFPKIDTQGGMIQHQGAESLQEMKHLGGKAIPQPKDSMNLTRNETLETRNQAVKEMEQTPEAQIPIKDALDLLPESEVENMNSAVMAPEPQPSDGKFLRGTLESCSEISLSPEYEDRETVTLTFPKIDTQGGMIEPYSGMGSLELDLEPRVQGEKLESLAQHLQSVKVIGEPPVLAVEPITLTTGPKPHTTDVIPGPQLRVKLTQMDTKSQLQNKESEVDPEKTKPESGPQSPAPKELIEETQPPKVKSVHLNLGPQQLNIKSGSIPGPRLPSVRFPTFYQGGKRGNLISGPPHYGVKSDEAPSCSPVPEIRSSVSILGPNLPEAKLQHVKPVEGNVGPCLQTVKFSDLTPEFHSREHTIPASELQYPSVISEEVNLELRQQDTKFSECASRLRLQGVKFGEQTPAPLFHSMHSMTPELGIHYPKLAKMTTELNDTKQVSFNSGPCLQNVKFFHGISGTQSQGVMTSELHSGPQLECVKMLEFTTQPERQGMKPELIIQETLFKDRTYVTRNQAQSFEDEMSYKPPSEPQIPTAESVRLTPGIQLQLASVDHSELVGRPEAQGIESSESIPGQHLGHIKPVEKVRASKQEEFTPGPHLGDVKSTELRSKSERGKVKTILLTPGKQAGDKEPEELPPGPNLKGLKSELLPSRPQLENRKSAVLTLGQCPERIKPTVVSPCSSQSDGTKTVKLIPGSTIQDLKTVGLARDTHVQDVNAMGLKLEPKQEEIPETFVPGIQFQDEFMEVLQVPQVQGIKPKELTAQSQMRGKKHVIISFLKSQSLKPVNIAKTQGPPGVKLVNLVSTQPCRGMAPMDLTLKPGQDDQITVRSPEWKGGVSDQLSKHFESENVLSMKSGQEAKPADKKPTEVKFKLQFKDTPSFESTPKPVVHSVKPEEAQDEPQGPSMKPCQVTPGPQEHQVKVSEPVLEPPFQDVKTMVLTEPHTESTKSVRWIPISEFQSEKWVGSDLRLQSQSAKPTELKPSTEWRGVRPSELTVRSNIIQEEKSVGLHLEPQSQQVKTSPLALGLQKTKTLNLTSEPQPKGIKTVDQNKDPPVGSVRSVQWIPRPEFHSVKCLGLNYGSQPQKVKYTEQKTSIQLGGVKPSETTLRPKLQEEKSVGFNLESQVHHTKTPELSPEPEIQKGENVTSSSEPQPQGIKTVDQNQDPSVLSVRSVQWIPGPEFHSVKSLGLNRGSQSQGVKSTEQKPSIQLGGVKRPETTVRPKLQGNKSADFNLEPKVQHIKTPEAAPKPELQEGENSEPQSECVKSVALHDRSEPQAECVKSVALHHGLQLENTKSVQWIPVSGYQAKKSMMNLRLQSEDVTAKELNPLAQLRNVKTSNELTTGLKLQSKQPTGSTPEQQSHGFKSIDFKSELQFRSMKGCDPNLRSKSNSRKFTFQPRFHLEVTGSPGLNPGMQPQEVTLGSPPETQPQSATSLVFKQESQASEANYGVLSQRAQPQSSMELKSAKSSESALQTKPWDIKSEINSGPQWQSAECSDLTPETESQNMKWITSSQGKPFANRSVQLDCEHGSQWQGIKSNPGLRTKSQKMEMEDCESGPKLQDLKSSRTIMGIKVQDVISLGFTPGPRLQSMPSEVLVEKRVHGVKLVESKPSSKLQSKKPDFTPRKMFLGTKSVELDSVPPSHDLKYSEQILGMKLQDVNSMEHHVTSIKSPELVTQIKSQGIKAMDFNSGSQPKNKKPSELAHGKELQSMESLIVGSKSPNGGSVELNLGPQLQDEKSKAILGIKQEDSRSTEVSSSPCLQGMRSSEVFSEDMLQGEKPKGFVARSLSQDAKFLRRTFRKALDRKLLQLKIPQFQDGKGSVLIPELHRHGMEPEAVKPGSKLKGMQPEPTNVQAVKGMGINHSAELQVVGFAEQDSDSTIYSVVPSELSARNLKQDGKFHKLSQKQQLQSIKPVVFSHKPHSQHIQSSEVCTKLPDLKPTEFNSEQQVRERKAPDVCTESKLSDEYKPGSYLQNTNSPAHISEPDPRCINSVCNPGPHFNGMNSVCILGPKLQSVDSTAYNYEPNLPDVNYSACTSVSSPPRVNSSICTPGPSPPRVNSSGCTPEPSPPCMNSTECNSKAHFQGVNSSACIPSQNPQCEHSNRNNLGPLLQGMHSGTTFPAPQIMCVNSLWCSVQTHLQNVNSSACTQRQESQCANSMGYNPGPHLEAPKLQGMKFPELNPGTRIQREMPITGPALGKPESPLGILYSREDPVSREPSKFSQSDSQTTSESPSSLESPSSETKLSEQLHLLKELQLKVAAKLSKMPLNVPPPPESGLVLKYPISLPCGNHKLQSASRSYLLIYPQIHLKKTPEGHCKTQMHLGFRLHIGKRPQVSKYPGRNRTDTSKNPSSSSHRKAKIYTPASKSPTSTRDFQSRSFQSPASVPVHRRQKQWGSRGVAGKTEAKDSGHYEFCEVLSTSESGSESNWHKKWSKSRLRKTSDLKYPMNKIIKELKTQNSRPTEECPSGTRTDPSRSKSIETAQTSTVSSKRQPKKSSLLRFIQLFRDLKQAFQRAHRVMALTGQKPEDRASPDNLWSSKNLYPEEKDEDDCLTGDGRGASTPVIKQRFMGSTPKKEERLQETCDQAQQSKQVSSLQPRPLESAKNIVSERNVIIQATSILQPLSRVLNVNSRTKKNYEFFSPESKKLKFLKNLSSKVGAKFQAQETLVPDSLLKRTRQSHFKHEQEHHRTYHSLSERSHSSSGSNTCSSPRERRGHNPSPKGLLGLYGRNHHSPPFQRCHSPSKRSHLSPIRRTWASPSERSHGTLSVPCKVTMRDPITAPRGGSGTVPLRRDPDIAV